MTVKKQLTDIPMSGRTAKAEIHYQVAQQIGDIVPLDQEPRLINFKHWYIVANRFPYDMIFSEHDLLLPVRKVGERRDLSLEEIIELNDIVDQLKNQYDLVFENFPHRRSVKAHYHLHLATYHKQRSDIKL